MLERSDARVMLLDLILLVALHGEQGIDLAFQAADGEEQFFVVGGGHWMFYAGAIVVTVPLPPLNFNAPAST